MKPQAMILFSFLVGCAAQKPVTNAITHVADTAMSGVSWLGDTGQQVARSWASPDGRRDEQSTSDNNSTAIDLWPTAGILPIEDSLAEVTIHGTSYTNTTAMERLNISAMVYGQYRIGVEASGTGQLREIIFCFEGAPVVGQSFCPLMLSPSGAFVNHGGRWDQL
jgi:hypothetical protein